ncbi:hypothetical protein BDZ89DRAFT_1261658, partial [Hymenopellis radicata]
NVSDDFDRALRLKGYIIRWATYSNGGVKSSYVEVVLYFHESYLTMILGCNELIFRPLITWWLLDPTTKQLRTFAWSATPTHSKNYTMSILRAIANVSFSVGRSKLTASTCTSSTSG